MKSLELKPQLTFYENPRAALDSAQASSFGNFLGAPPERLRRAAQLEMEDKLEGQCTRGGIPHRGRRIVAVAVAQPSS